MFYLLLKGHKEILGKIQGSIEGRPTIGTIYKNTNFGVYGSITSIGNLDVNLSRAIPIALRSEITTGSATLITSIDNEETKEYDIEIQKIYTNNDLDNKSMVIKVTDEELLSKTGGIVQGMSGSPIIQNGKLVGALTHVMVNNLELGYAVFAEMMVKQMGE